MESTAFFAWIPILASRALGSERNSPKTQFGAISVDPYAVWSNFSRPKLILKPFPLTKTQKSSAEVQKKVWRKHKIEFEITEGVHTKARERHALAIQVQKEVQTQMQDQVQNYRQTAKM